MLKNTSDRNEPSSLSGSEKIYVNSVNVRQTGSRTVHDVPAVNLALVVPDERAAVVLDDARQVGRGEAAARDPAGQLVIPDAVVT